MASLSMNNSAIKGLAFPIAASVLAGAATMFLPTALLESFTGATGLSEIFPATAAPLGDTARALIAFSAGALTLAVTAIVTNRKGPSDMAAHQFKPVFTDNVEEASPSMAAKIMERFAGIRSKGFALPWRKADDSKVVVRDLVDLPKIRNADSHPDAPARRPLSAELDLGEAASEIEVPTPTPTARFWNDEKPAAAVAEVSESATQRAPVMPVSVEPSLSRVYVPTLSSTPEIALEVDSSEPASAPVYVAPAAAEPVTAVLEVDKVEAVAKPEAIADATIAQAPLSELVAQLEAAVNQRQEVLDRLASAQAQISEQRAAADAMAVKAPVSEAGSEQPAQPVQNDGYVPPYFDRPPLEAVPSVQHTADVAGDAQEDEALRAALATLRRMNASG
jgi:hypothetical protein